jgi:hypothetical protein
MIKSASLIETDGEILLVGKDKDETGLVIDRMTGNVKEMKSDKRKILFC